MPLYICTSHDWEDGATKAANVGQRVEIHPGTDTWMMGDRFGRIVKLGRSWVHVKFERSGRIKQVHGLRLRAIGG